MNESKKWFTTVGTLGAALLTFSAVAMAQTPTSSAAVTPSETASVSITETITAGTTPSIVTGTGTATEGATASVGTGTSTVTPGSTTTADVTGTSTSVATSGTAIPTGGTAVATSGTAIPTIPVPTNVYVAGGTGGFAFADPAFQKVWNRTDLLVAGGNVARTWFWGPGPNSVGLSEQYNQGANDQRLVQYFDKSRMEINNPAGDQSSAFYVTNGLLTVELISGFIQVGDADFTEYRPACIPMSGDFGDTLAPTYFAFQGVSNTQAGDHNSTDQTGKNATATIDRNGVVGDDASKAKQKGVNFVHFENNHNIPAIFWDFLNSSGPVSDGNGKTTNEQLINPWYFASGLPISEPYWAQAKIGGVVKDVLIQAYERRVLTYVPTNDPGFQVEMGNIGQHYFDWRYRNYGYCSGQPISTPTAPVPAPTGTVVSATGTPGAVVTGTTTPVATGTVSGTVSATTTAVGTGTVVATTTAVATGTEVGTGTPVTTETTTTTPVASETVGSTVTTTVSPVASVTASASVTP